MDIVLSENCVKCAVFKIFDVQSKINNQIELVHILQSNVMPFLNEKL